MLEPLGGTWRRGWVRGESKQCGWGAAAGYPGIRLDESGERVAVQVLESRALAEAWVWLDEFEGAEYRRMAVVVRLECGARVHAFISELAS